jgi:hypothetical protein
MNTIEDQLRIKVRDLADRLDAGEPFNLNADIDVVALMLATSAPRSEAKNAEMSGSLFQIVKLLFGKSMKKAAGRYHAAVEKHLAERSLRAA